jgi:AcrR family transcriptional regulator
MSQSHDELRERATGLAYEMVDAEGLAGLTVRRLAADLGCSVGTVYNLFVDLDDIVLHVAARVLDDMYAAIFAEGLPTAPVERLVEVARRYIRFAASRRRLWAMVFEHEPAHDRPTPDWQLARVERLVAEVRATIAPNLAITAGARDSAADFEVLWASVHGIAALGLKGKLGFVTGTEAEALAERLVRALVRTSPQD